MGSHPRGSKFLSLINISFKNSLLSEKYKVQLTFETGFNQPTNENKLKDTKSNFLMCVLMI